MGVNQSARSKNHILSDNQEVNFDHFQILRAIGKGSFGKVCIVQKKDTQKLYAMKYMNKAQCLEKDAIGNVMREIEIMTQLDHPFLVNLWFSFQDEEDMFMVFDLLLGGDLRYHIQQNVSFNSQAIAFYTMEIALALDYLQSKRIVHRDIKPDNILLDEQGHAHLADFNVATVLEEGQLASSLSGTKPYMAPEIFICAIDEGHAGYGFPVDWWSLGIVAYELASGRRPFDIRSNTSIVDIKRLFDQGLQCPETWDENLIQFLKKLLEVDASKRLSSLTELVALPLTSSTDTESLLAKTCKPPFMPRRDHLNCDPTFELEEMIIEAKPLHKKKKRLAKQRSLREIQVQQPQQEVDPAQAHLEHIAEEFTIYNRERELAQQEMDRREREWEAELLEAMGASGSTSGTHSQATTASKSELRRCDSEGNDRDMLPLRRTQSLSLDDSGKKLETGN